MINHSHHVWFGSATLLGTGIQGEGIYPNGFSKGPVLRFRDSGSGRPPLPLPGPEPGPSPPCGLRGSPQLSERWMEKAVHPARREAELGYQLQNRTRSQAAGREGALQVESGEKYVGIRLQSHGIF